MHDILPENQEYFQKFYAVAKDVAEFYGFQRIDTPIVEDAELYEKGTGVATDIVEKQMYLLKTRGGDTLALRPEFTPGIARAYLQHGMINLPQPVKLYTSGQLFRHERSQAGRFRQFHQFDAEVFGETSPAVDAQIIQLFTVILQELKIGHILVEINSVGDSQCRPYYKKLLVNFLRQRQQQLCVDCKRRVRENPLRTLDCKEEKCQRVRQLAPQILDHLCEECKKHFRQVLEFLDEADIPYHLDPYLVRGLDYYTKTVLEIFSERQVKQQEGDQEVITRNALVGGGRYDTLVKLYGNKDVPAVGAAAGTERIVSFLREQEPALPKNPKVFLAQLGDLPKKKSLKLLEEFRKAKIQIAESLGRDSLKVQMARADKLGVQFTLILGQREALDNTIVIRRMDNGTQETVKFDKTIEEIKKRLKK